MAELPRLELRTLSVQEDGCLSAMLWDGQKFAVCIERTFDDNRTVLRNGEYLCRASYYLKGGYATFEIMVAGHSRVLFHKGNTEMDSLGCVVLGKTAGYIGGKMAVLHSADAFDAFIERTASLSSFILKVSGR